MKPAIVIVGVAFTLGAWATQQPKSRGGPTGTFRTEVPVSPLNVIAGAPTASSVKLSILSPISTTFQLSVTAPDAKKLKAVTGSLMGGVPAVINLNDLSADSTYRYHLVANDTSLDGNFCTAKRPQTPFSFVIQADSHLDENSSLEIYRNTLQNEVADHPDFLIDLGDTFMVDKRSTYTDSLVQYAAQRYWFSQVGHAMAVYLCLGNHDGETGWRRPGDVDVSAWARAQRVRNFPTITANDFYSGAPAQGLYYSWTWGDALLVVLDPFVATTRKPRTDEDGWNWSLGKTQFDWLESTLRHSGAKYKFLFIHHLVGGQGREARGGAEASDRFEWGDLNSFPEKRKSWTEPIHDLMRHYRVSALFHGHDHLYVRQERDGIAYIEVPQPSQARVDSTQSAQGYGYTTGKVLGSSGHIRVKVSPSVARIEYVKSRLDARNREVVDSFEIRP